MDTSNPFHGDPALMGIDEKHSESVESIIDQIFSVMVKHMDKKHFAMSKLVENLPFSLDILNDRFGSPTNHSKYKSLNMY